METKAMRPEERAAFYREHGEVVRRIAAEVQRVSGSRIAGDDLRAAARRLDELACEATPGPCTCGGR